MKTLQLSINIFLLSIAVHGIGCGETTTNKEEDAHAHHEMMANARQKAFGAESYIKKLEKGLIEKDTLKGSPERVTMTNIGDNHLHLTYHSPGTKGRVIWGGLVPYGEVWVAGAHQATNLSFPQPIVIQNKVVPAGTYALFVIPDQKEWTVILNKNYDQHLTDEYDSAEDVIRFSVEPTPLNQICRRLTYNFENKNNSETVLHFKWEKIGFSFLIKNQQ